ncbi:PspC domain-containing protein [Gorillibacterium sp. sgz5001074]|uniref:PspC domain-containing protein n=1 Tax=Gorillibacterium sp. sgz5001074 TaxID=3446695 RepID=UPI003F675A8F
MRLERSRTDVRLFGLCAGLARTSGIGTGWIRFGLIAGTLLTGGTLFFIYIVASMLVPKEPLHRSYTGDCWYVPAQEAYAFGGAAAYPGYHQPARMDSLMQDLEEQAMVREIRELRAKLARYEDQL